MVKVLQGQSLLDIAIQTAGDVSAAFALAVANDLSLTDELPAGMELKTVDVVNRDIATYYKNKNLTPATALTGDALESDHIFDDPFDNPFE